ncbi:MAG TPA: DUF5606 domain-containing protein [Bacteroidales bacterium]|jgi:hypothetical protein|nr:DUF5606 domain-containing protein [Bacteroidales bacterium]HOS71476.1 DUF5606 domain-containing protein [Bacteroidales bacterium]HQH23926.1 DUF5606 domain-containing protein [Bacteroidales bacterium]HQJ81256.1 DUF5606 domain-containing protein [Bacteroidales bacterium]
MLLKDLMAIPGQPGLFRFIAQGKNAIIVEHLETRKRSTVFSSARASSLEEISVFTENEDLPLGKVFDKIHEKENGGPAIDHKSDPEKLRSWFGEILPDYNRERVYVSDIKKIIQWYNTLHKLDLLVREETAGSVEDGESEASATDADAVTGTDAS